MRGRRVANLGLIGLALALGLGVWLSLQSQPGPPPLTPLAPSTIESVRIAYPRADDRPALVLQRGRAGWRLSQPIERAARDGRLVTLLAIFTARSDACYAAAEHDAARVGLDQPRASVDAGGHRIAFGDRAPDGRRYVASGQRYCLVVDHAYPVLARGLDGLGMRRLLPVGARPVRIVAPGAVAERRSPDEPWQLTRGTGDAAAWAHNWRTARAAGFALDVDGAGAERVRVDLAEQGHRAWRLLQRDGHALLLPEGGDYALRLAPAGQRPSLLTPPRRDER